MNCNEILVSETIFLVSRTAVVQFVRSKLDYRYHLRSTLYDFWQKSELAEDRPLTWHFFFLLNIEPENCTKNCSSASFLHF